MQPGEPPVSSGIYQGHCCKKLNASNMEATAKKDGSKIILPNQTISAADFASMYFVYKCNAIFLIFFFINSSVLKWRQSGHHHIHDCFYLHAIWRPNLALDG